jgi:hypothetical protein
MANLAEREWLAILRLKVCRRLILLVLVVSHYESRLT